MSLHVARVELRARRVPHGLFNGGDVRALRHGRDNVEHALRCRLADLAPGVGGRTLDSVATSDTVVDIELTGPAGGESSGQFGDFNGSRPLTDGQVANAVLASTTVGVLVSAVIWAVFMAATLLILEQRTGRSSLQGMVEQFELTRPLEFVLLGVRPLGFGTVCIGAVLVPFGALSA
jgi:hypothetical protein